jgi:hypothetical protein
MSSSNGAVGVMVQVPVLGTVTGVRTLKDIVAGTPVRLPTDKPAVVTRELDEPIRVATLSKAPTPTVATPTPTVAKPTASPKPKPTPSGTTPPGAKDPEAEATKLMQIAENYIGANMKPMAIRKLKEIVKKYPNTKAGIDAEVKLSSLDG